jgi:Polyketide cyclase / dehydrase and lipid transport
LICIGRARGLISRPLALRGDTILYWILAIIVIAILAVLGLAASKPNSFRVTRETHIKAPPARVAALINDFHEWPKWSPSEKMDPAMTRTHSGAASGTGAVYECSGNKKVGQGRMEIAGTAVNWTMTGESPFMFRLMGLFTNMDAMIG